ncbi:hypothetical protein B0H13DRAFT_1903601 [Mycena leptocephala]|nr:hypothetical protein B0H13DRAFT_1903601 [Mycena leptocephala]
MAIPVGQHLQPMGEIERSGEACNVGHEETNTSLGRGHPMTLWTMFALVNTYHQLGRWKKAEELAVLVMKKREQIQGEDHPETVWIMTELVSMYQKLGRATEAQVLFKDIDRILRKHELAHLWRKLQADIDVWYSWARRHIWFWPGSVRFPVVEHLKKKIRQTVNRRQGSRETEFARLSAVKTHGFDSGLPWDFGPADRASQIDRQNSDSEIVLSLAFKLRFFCAFLETAKMGISVRATTNPQHAAARMYQGTEQRGLQDTNRLSLTFHLSHLLLILDRLETHPHRSWMCSLLACDIAPPVT